MELLLYAHYPHKRIFEFDAETFDVTVIFLLSGGSFAWEIGGEAGQASAGDAVCCPPGMEFRRRVLEPVNLHVLRFRDCIPLPYKISFGDSARIRQDLELGTDHILNMDFTEVQRHYLTDIPWTLADISGMFSRDICRDPRINEAALYIKEHFAKPLTVEAIAADCGFSTAAFIRRFGSAVGMTPGKWLIHCRMEHAAELLAASDYTIPEIAARCGYQSEFYFMNSFRKHYGVTAAEYRAGNRVK